MLTTNDSRRLRRRESVEATISRVRALKRRYTDVHKTKWSHEGRVLVELPEPVRAG